MKTVILNPSAARTLDKLGELDRSRLTEAIYAYALDKPSDTKAMSGTPTVRLRVGDFRVVFDETGATVTVLALGHRRDIYR